MIITNKSIMPITISKSKTVTIVYEFLEFEHSDGISFLFFGYIFFTICLISRLIVNCLHCVLFQADGREVNLSLIYPVLIGSRMLGSTAFPWLFREAKLLGNEDCLMTAMGVAGIALFIVAYDYQVRYSQYLLLFWALLWKLICYSSIITGDWSSTSSVLHLSCLCWF